MADFVTKKGDPEFYDSEPPQFSDSDSDCLKIATAMDYSESRQSRAFSTLTTLACPIMESLIFMILISYVFVVNCFFITLNSSLPSNAQYPHFQN